MNILRLVLIVLSTFLAIFAGFHVFTSSGIGPREHRYCGFIAFATRTEYNDFYWKLVNDASVSVYRLDTVNTRVPIIVNIDVVTKNVVDYAPKYKITVAHYIGYGLSSLVVSFVMWSLLYAIICAIWDKMGWERIRNRRV